MADTTFVDQQTVVFAAWLNDVNIAVYRAIGTGFGGLAPTTPAEVRANLGLTAVNPISGASLIGNNPIGGSAGGDVQEALDLKLNIADAFTDPRHRWNDWDDADTVGNAAQKLEYTVTSNGSVGDRVGWQAIVNEDSASNPDNFVALVGHALHLGNWDGGAYWGIATEAWSTADGAAVLVGGELSVIQQEPGATATKGSVGMNAVFKNRPDVATNPTAPVIDGSLYNYDSKAVYITSQARPSGAGAAWSAVGSGWQTAIKIGDVGFGSGLDWEGGSNYPGSDTYKAYTTVIDMTDALSDLAGGTPWAFLYRNSATYWGMCFRGTLTGQLDTKNLVVNAGGAGYVIGDIGTINGGTGAGAQYYVRNVAGGAVTELAVRGTAGAGGSGYTPAVGLATTATSGVGAGLTVDLRVAIGYFYGAVAGVAAGGGGYAVNDVVRLVGGVAGTVIPTFRVTTVAAGVVTGLEFQTNEMWPPGVSQSLSNSNGHGFTVGTYATITTGAGLGLTIAITKVFNDYVIGGERWEYWRMTNPSNPTGTGQRQDFMDASFPGNDGDQITTVAAAAATVSSYGHVIANFAGACTLTLPAPANGRMLSVRTIQNQAVNSAAANVIPLAGGAAGAAIVPNTAGRWANLVGDGTNWQIQMAG